MFFETADLIADELTLADAEAFHRICNQPYILRWMDDWEMSLEQVEGLLSYFIKGYEAKDPERIPFILAVRTKDGRLIGICGFGPKEKLGGDAEIAFFIDEAFCRRGYMSQMVEKAVEFYFYLTGKPYLSALVNEENTPSKRILEKSGFVYYDVNDSSGVLKPHYRRFKDQ